MKLKKLMKFWVILLSLGGMFYFAKTAEATEDSGDIMDVVRESGITVDELYRPKASMLLEANTGRVIWQENADLQRPIASLSKIMTAYLVLEAIEEGKFSLETQIQPSEKVINIANIYALSNNKMFPGVDYSVDELLYLLFIPSSNAATVMLADLVLPNDEAGFVNLMNEKATELGMENTIYYNATGANAASFEGFYLPEGIDPNGDNLSTVRDLAILTYNLIKKHDNALKYTSVPTYTVHPGTEYAEDFTTYNFSLPGASHAYDGVDGLKTGSSPSADYGLVATAKRGETRIIEVLLGVGSWELQLGEEERHPLANALFDKGFNEYEYRQVLPQGEQEINGEKLTLTEDLFDVVAKESSTEPVYEMAEDKLSLTTELPLVSPLLEKPSAAYEVAKPKLFKKESTSLSGKLINKKSESIFTYIQKYFISIVAVIVGLILMIISTFFKEAPAGRRRKTRQSKVGRVILVVGLVPVVFGLGVALLTALNLI